MKSRKKHKRKKSSVVLIVIAVIILIAGLSLMLYPLVSNFIGTMIAEQITKSFDNTVDSIINIPFEQAKEEKIVDEEGYPLDKNGNRTSETKAVFKADIDRLYKDSITYNQSPISYRNTGNTFNYTDAALDLSEYGIYDGIYCYISAPTINMRLPVYLGANDYNMSYGAAHLCNTSLPLSGESVNAAIAAHTGYIGRIFFDNISKLEIGDSVSIKNYFETIEYNVINKKIVEENDSKDMYIQDGKQLLTLITCISDGNDGFNRYLVICERK